MKSFVEESKKIINKASINNKLVIFVGAGVSMNSGYPSWTNLITEFANGLGLNISQLSDDDYLKIPQYYYNLRKEKEYYDVVLNKFDINAKPNKIHELMLELNPNHIITTNYDDLIERACNKKGLFFDVVAKDKDLPYSINNKMIIKMHGSLENRNIVLKEDDYLSYFNEFKLIQNYIKSLLSTHIVLFLGYSIRDVNVKYIFQWVKDILKNDFQPVYFIEDDDSIKFNQLEFEYYRNRGVNIIYSSEFNNIEYFKKDFEFEGITNERARSIIRFLNYLYENDENANLNIDLAYEKLKILEPLSSIKIEEINTVLGLKLPYTYEESIYYNYYDLKNETLNLVNKKLEPFFRELKEKKFDDKSKYIKQIFFNAGINEIKDENKQSILSFKDEFSEDNFVNNDIYLFNYENLLNKSSNNLYRYITDDEKKLDLAYILYKLGEYSNSYDVLKIISEHCLEGKKYYRHFLSEFNRFHMGKLISENTIKFLFMGIDIDPDRIIMDEFNKIDLNNIYLKLPKHKSSDLDVYREILTFQFVYRHLRNINELEKKIESEKDCIVSGPQKNNGSIYELRKIMEVFYEFILKNRLFIDNYTEVRMCFYKFVENMLFNYSLELSYNEDSYWGIPGEIPSIKEIDYFTIYSMINYLSLKELKGLFEKYGILRLDLDEETFSRLVEVEKNIFYVLKNDKKIIDIKEKYCKLIFIISNINLGNKNFEFNNLIENFITILKSNPKIINKDLISVMNNAISNQFKEFETEFKEETLLELIENLLLLDGRDTKITDDIEIFIVNILFIIGKINFKGTISLEVFITKLIKNSKNMGNYYTEILINSYFVLPDANKPIVIEKIVSILEDCNSFRYNEFCLYKMAILNDIIEVNINFEKKVFDFIDKEAKEKESNKKVGITIGKMYQYEDLLMDLFYLLVDNKILDLNLISKYRDKNKYLMFILENKDIKFFKAEFIIDFTDDLNKELSKNNAFTEKIEKYLIKNYDNKDILEKYFKFYC